MSGKEMADNCRLVKVSPYRLSLFGSSKGGGLDHGCIETGQ